MFFHEPQCGPLGSRSKAELSSSMKRLVSSSYLINFFSCRLFFHFILPFRTVSSLFLLLFLFFLTLYSIFILPHSLFSQRKYFLSSFLFFSGFFSLNSLLSTCSVSPLTFSSLCTFSSFVLSLFLARLSPLPPPVPPHPLSCAVMSISRAGGDRSRHRDK